MFCQTLFQSSFLRICILIFEGFRVNPYNPKMKKTRMAASKPERAATSRLPDSSGLFFLYVKNQIIPAGGSRNEIVSLKTRNNLFRLHGRKTQFIKQDPLPATKLFPGSGIGQ